MLTLDEYNEWKKDLKKEQEDRIDMSDRMGIEKWLFRKGITGGVILIMAALVWLYIGYYLEGAIYLYPFILILIGLAAIIRHVVVAIRDKDASA